MRTVREVVIGVIRERFEGYPPQGLDDAAVIHELLVDLDSYSSSTLGKMVTVIAGAQAALTPFKWMIAVIEEMQPPQAALVF